MVTLIWSSFDVGVQSDFFEFETIHLNMIKDSAHIPRADQNVSGFGVAFISTDNVLLQC